MSISEQQLEQVKGRIEELLSDLNEREQRRKVLLDELQVTEKRIGFATQRLRQLGERLEQQQLNLSRLEERHLLQRRELQRQQEILGRQMRAAYAMGRQERLKILLNQQDPAIVSRMLVYYDYLNRARLDEMNRTREVIAALKASASALEEERNRLLELRSREAVEQLRLGEGRQLCQQVIAALDEEIHDKGQRLTELKIDEQRLRDLVNELQETLILQPLERAGNRPFESLKGELRWPSKGVLAAGFGSPKAGSLLWDGVMIAAPEGREVRAVHRGRIAFADWLRGFGLLLIVDHGDGYMTLYGHNQSLYKETGEWVESGEPVALVGNSGGRAAPGVYFGIRYKGKPVNPRQWCVRIKGNRITGSLNSAPASLSNRHIKETPGRSGDSGTPHSAAESAVLARTVS